MSEKGQIGFSQRVRLEWFDLTAELLLAGNNAQQITASLKDHLRDQLSVGGNAERGNREKAITILLRTWVTVPKDLESLRNDAMASLQRTAPKNRLPLHWGMILAAYPFFGVVAETVGWLLSLQATVAPSQIQRRIREQFGERETVARAARRILRSLVDWTVLTETDIKGVYAPGSQITIQEQRLASLLIEACLASRPGESACFRELVADKRLFPFSFTLSARDLDRHPRLEVLSHSEHNDPIIVRHSGLS